MNELLKIVLSLSLSGSVLILILFLCRPLYKSNMSKVWQYYIWLAVVARLLLPIAPEHNLVGTLFRNYDHMVSQSETTVLPESDFRIQPAADPVTNVSPVKLPDNLGLIWIVVVLILLIRKITIYQSFIKYIKAGRSPVDDIHLLEQFGHLVEEANIHTGVELYTNSLISSPLLTGFFRPCIVLPGTACSDLEFQYTIRHELQHYTRKDMFYKWLIQLTVCLHWFNPLVYFMARDVSRLCELSCDEMVIRHLDRTAMRDYGDTLLRAVRSGGNYKNSLASVTLHESKELLKERLDAIMNYKKQSRTFKILTFFLTLMIGIGGVFTGAYASASKDLPSGDIVFQLTNNEHNGITKSDSFEAEDGQVLTITIQSDIRGGTVNLFLFSPDNKQHSITVSDSDETKTIALSAGRWAYNCTGFFKSGTVTITGTVSHSSDHTAIPVPTEPEIESSSGTVMNLSNNGQYSITKSGSFKAEDGQVLTITVQSDIRDGSVDLFLFSPDSKEQRITLGGSDETKTIVLSAGKWSYNCTGFFKSGNITLIGELR